MIEQLRHCWLTPLTGLTLLDVILAGATLMAFSVIVEVIGWLFTRGQADETAC